MKSKILIGLILLIGVFAFNYSEKTILHGKVSEADSGEVLPFAKVEILKDTKLVAKTQTDFDGQYVFDNLESGTYTLRVSFIGYITEVIENVLVKKGEKAALNIRLESSALLEEVVVTKDFKKPLPVESSSITSDEIKSLPTKAIDAIAATSAGSKSSTKPAESGAKLRGSRAEATEYFVDGTRIKEAPIPMPPSDVEEVEYEAPEMSDIPEADLDLAKTSEKKAAGITKKDRPRAGQLTAGEWNDLHNWEDWQALQEEEGYKKYQDHWGFKPINRYSTFVTNDYELPLVNAEVSLRSKSGDLLWTSMTDNAGKAELWTSVLESQEEAYSIEVKYKGITQSKTDLKTISEGSNHISLPIECDRSSEVDIMFVVDATGSMSDEIYYLQSELVDVLERAKEENDALNIRLGSVFYRDHGDAYLTKNLQLTSNLEEASSFLEAQSAGGGGDYPEAVEKGLEDALMQDWNEDAVAKLLFLVLDAPPHKDAETLINLRTQVKLAAEMGIKIIPITASGINRQTEFLMKYMSIVTNGTYVFITDHSGIGGKHLDPVVKDFEVEKLNDLMLRLIYQYTKENGCADNQYVSTDAFDFELYPNPAAKFVNVETEEGADLITIASASGQILHKSRNIAPGVERLDIHGLVSGSYTLSVKKEDKMRSRQMIVIR